MRMVLKRLILLWWLSLSLFVFYPLSDPSDVPACWWRLDEQREVRFLSSALSFPLFFLRMPQNSASYYLCANHLPLTFKDQPLNSKPHSYSVHHPLEGHQNHYPLQGSHLPARTLLLRVHAIAALLEIHLKRRCGLELLKGCSYRFPWGFLQHTTDSHGSTAWLTF